MKKILTAAFALLICFSSFAASSIKFSSLRLGISNEDFKGLLDNCLGKNGVYSGDATLESFGKCHFVGFFTEDTLTELSICINELQPADFDSFNATFKKVEAAVAAVESLNPADESEEFTLPFAQGDGREFQALCLGYYSRYATYENDSMIVRIASGAQGLIFITLESRAGQQSTSSDHHYGAIADFSDNNDSHSSDPNSSITPITQPQPQTQSPSIEDPGKQNGSLFSNDKFALRFEGIPVVGSAKDFAQQLAAKKGFSIANDSNPNQIFVKGPINNINDCEIYIINGDNGLINNITVFFPAQATWQDLSARYSSLKNYYDNRTNSNFEIIDSRATWDGTWTGREMEGVRLDKCLYLTKYKINNRHNFTLFISKYARVTLYYEVEQTFTTSGNLTPANKFNIRNH